ncbi:YfaP family protein [Azorhizobium doebereinerae]|uniref:YfaP family protein n=1 Tax=Azorhizobium doebereinerae TaxID=281091 RepID=UPI0004273258|nr:hypothetical protein [Azorhizobium doebereinerae]
MSTDTYERADVIAAAADAAKAHGEFHDFANAIERRFREMAGGELYAVDAGDLFSVYLAAYPDGTNPIFRVRTEHDCSCCKNFVRNVGHLVSLQCGQISTVWDVAGLEYPFDVVAAKLAEHVLSRPISTVFRTKEFKFGAHHTNELREEGVTRRWHHFFCDVPSRFRSDAPDAARGEVGATAQVLRRGLEELSADSIETVVDLIQDNALYRGAEFEHQVLEFLNLHARYPRERSASEKDAFIWAHVGRPAARFRNTVIGTLVQDIAAGVDLDHAVRSYEAKVAPQNYKRPTALITPRMISDAITKLKDLGLESAVERRFARMSDVSVNNVLFVDNSVRGAMKDGLAGLLMEAVKPVMNDVKGAEPIAIEEFLSRIVPQATSIGLLLENKHLQNFMSLTAPVHADAGKLFKWGNGFAWSYDGDAADSIKQRVKRAGGNVDADLRVSLAWFNTDDLDLHVIEPSGRHVFYGDKCGILDVDMNVSNLVRDPVENLSWVRPLRDGRYLIQVHQFTRRESIDIGFVLEVEHRGKVDTFTYERAVSGLVNALSLEVLHGTLAMTGIGAGLKSGSLSQEKWGVKTGTLVPVDTLMASPNHWDGQATGNKHWFFFLKDCRNPSPARGIYNEFLSPALDPHRKVFEVLGAKSKCAPETEQLSGVGFSSTRHDQVTVVAKGDCINKAFAITF